MCTRTRTRTRVRLQHDTMTRSAITASVCLNVAAHAAAWTMTWAVALSRGDYRRAAAYVLCVVVLRVPTAFVCARLARTAAENAKLALVGVVCGGAVAGAFLCMDGAGVLGDSDAGGTGATTALLVALNQFDPMALLVVFAATASAAAATDARDSGQRLFAAAQTARMLGTLSGAALFTVAWVAGHVGAAQVLTGALLLGVQVPLVPLEGLGGVTRAGASIATVTLRETDRTARSIAALPVALAVDAAVALSLSIAVATWSYQTLALWDTLYPNSVVAMVANSVSFAVLSCAAFVARSRAMGIDAAPSAAAVAAADATAAATHTKAPPQERPWRHTGGSGGGGGGGMNDASVVRLRRRLYVHALVLACAVGASAVLDISLRFETPAHAAISLAVACAAVQVDQLAVQVATLANAHIAGTWVQVALFYVLASARAVLWAAGFVAGWFWRERLHVSAIYALPFAAVAYALRALSAHPPRRARVAQ